MRFKKVRLFFGNFFWKAFPPPWQQNQDKTKEDLYREKGVKIGEYTKIFGQLDGVNPEIITIGRYCVVGVQSAVLTHCPIKGGMPVVIGDYVWMGFDVKILGGVSIGSNCIVGAGSVVTKDIPSNSIAAGVPAKIIRQLTDKEVSKLIIELESDEPIGKIK